MSKNSFISMEDNQKFFEAMEASRQLMPGLPFLIRLDGRAFSTFTQGLERPYDMRLRQAMMDTTAWLVKEFQPSIGYTQSDEISLGFPNNVPAREMLFGGRIQKLCSIVASATTAYFNRRVQDLMPEKKDTFPVFDARVWAVNSLAVAAEHFMWREADAIRNSLSMACHAFYSHKDLKNISMVEQHKLLGNKGVDWNEYPTLFKRGVYFRREKVLKQLSDDELKSIPLKHRPSGPVERTVIQQLELPPLATLSNLEEVLFHFAHPVGRSTQTQGELNEI